MPEAAVTGSVLDVSDLTVTYPVRSALLQRVVARVRAVDHVSFSIGIGETVGLVGESGCGKSTVGRAICGLTPIESGSVSHRSAVGDGSDRRSGGDGKERQVQMVFQDPYSSLNPMMTVSEIISEGWSINPDLRAKDRWDAGVEELLRDVGLSSEMKLRKPRQLSGGERQRGAIARSLAVRPRLLICDEVTSALDVSVKAQLLVLLERLRQESQLAYLFISHDITAVQRVAHRVLVMYLGQIVELGSTREVFGEPAHPYTSALLSAAPRLRPWSTHRERIVLQGEVPSAAKPLSGCRFHTRCWLAQELGTARPGGICAEREPPLAAAGDSRLSACHFSNKMTAALASRAARVSE